MSLIQKDFPVVPQEGIEPPTRALRMRCSTPELLRRPLGLGGFYKQRAGGSSGGLTAGDQVAGGLAAAAQVRPRAWISARSFQTSWSASRPPRTAKRSMKRMPSKAVPSGQTPYSVP